MINLKKILVPIDFSECSESALRFAASLAKHFDSEIILFHCIWMTPHEYTRKLNADYDVSYTQFLEDQRVDAEAKMFEMEIPGIESRERVTEISVQGDPTTQIIDFAEENDVDLIVLGTHGRTGLKHFFLGSVAERTVRHAGCPVITVRDKALVPVA